jgi:hypothetical protein
VSEKVKDSSLGSSFYPSSCSDDPAMQALLTETSEEAAGDLNGKPEGEHPVVAIFRWAAGTSKGDSAFVLTDKVALQQLY